MADEQKSEAQQDKESRLKKVEENLKNEYEKLFNEHQDAVKDAREDQPDNAETEEEYKARVQAVQGGLVNADAFNPQATEEAVSSTNVTPEEQAQTRPVTTNVDLAEAQEGDTPTGATDQDNPTPAEPAVESNV